MSEKIITSYTGLSFLQVLTIVFVVLKLTNVINWSWWWVLAPLWIPVILCVGCFIVGLIVLFVYYCLKID